MRLLWLLFLVFCGIELIIAEDLLSIVASSVGLIASFACFVFDVK